MLRYTFLLSLCCFGVGCDLILGIGSRVERECVPGVVTCEDGIRSVCLNDGSGEDPDPCPQGQFCESDGECTQNCVASAARCEEGVRWVCRPDGSGEDSQTCPSGELCVAGGVCEPAECLEAEGQPVAGQTAGDCRVRRCVARLVVEQPDDGDAPACSYCDAGEAFPAVSALARGPGYGHMCALACDGRVACWGRNTEGQLGVPGLGVGGSSVPLWVPLADSVTGVAMGFAHTCVSLVDGRVQCFGLNDEAQVVPGSPSPKVTVPFTIPSLANVVDLGAGGSSTCVVVDGGGVRCFGRNDTGQLGVPGAVSGVVDVPLPAIGSPAAAVALGGGHGCSLHQDGQVVCWGSRPSTGRNDNTAGFAAPEVVAGLVLEEISGGDYHTCGVTPQNVILCFGGNGSGQANPFDTFTVLTPQGVAVPGSPDQVAAGWRASCAGGPAGFHCWGINLVGVQSVGSFPIEDIAVPWTHQCVLSNGRVLCWGENHLGQTGIGQISGYVAQPTPIVWPPTE